MKALTFESMTPIATAFDRLKVSAVAFADTINASTAALTRQGPKVPDDKPTVAGCACADIRGSTGSRMTRRDTRRVFIRTVAAR